MSSERYPVDLAITNQDFVDCGWKVVLAGCAREGYSSMWQAFSAAARQAIADGKLAHGKVLWLLADACSMMLSPASTNEPFKPIAVFGDKRSVIPEDLLDTDISFFSEIVDLIDDPWLKARIAELLWLKLRPRDIKYVTAAIDAYRSVPLDEKTWVRGGRECWQRAIRLALMIGDAAGNRVEETEAALLGVFDAVAIKDGYLGLWLTDLLKQHGLGREKRIVIAQKLESLARDFDGEGDLHRSRDYFGAAAEWFKLSGDDAKHAEMTAAVAEGWVKEAIARLSSERPSYMVATTFYENAIQTYRTIPRSERQTHGVDERIAELRRHLTESGEKSLGEMGVIKSPSMDISKLVENARNAVRGKDAVEALKAFANLHHGAKAKELRENALESMRQHPLQALFGASVMSRDGRVIAKKPSMGLGSKLTDDDEVAIRFQMIRNYGILVSIVVQGDILPALEVLLLEHRFVADDFVAMASQSPIVPKGREGLFGRALFAGYDRDFVVALHLLVPQIEHMVRFHLKQAGAKTTNLDVQGIENEIGLSALMDLPEAGEIFGEDLAFEIKALFCDAFGPNLRNELAHGLIGEGECQSIFAIYAWWFGLRLVFNAYWVAVRKATADEKEGGENG